MADDVEREAKGPARAGWGAIKIALGVVVATKLALASLWLVDEGSAQARGRGPDHPALEPVPVTVRALQPPQGHEEARTLLESLARRQTELTERERALTAREDRVALYEEDLTAKIAHLESLQQEMSRDSKVAEDADSEAASSLAKVYAAMKPADAAPLLDRLDDDTVLRILAHMRAKQIGELLPLLDREKAIVLTQALASGR
jgi:hypothetical protein